jgi:hypothetical protein
MSAPIPAAAPASSRPVLEHLNSAAPTASTSADVPSVFETLAAEELRDLIQPAFRYVLAVSSTLLLFFWAWVWIGADGGSLVVLCTAVPAVPPPIDQPS